MSERDDDLDLPHAQVHADGEGVTIEPGGDRQAAHLTLEELDKVREKAEQAAAMITPLAFYEMLGVVQEIAQLPWRDLDGQPRVWLASVTRQPEGHYRVIVYDARTDTLHTADTRGEWRMVRRRLWAPLMDPHD